MVALPQEFAFLPLELVLKVGRFVRRHHDAHGTLLTSEADVAALNSPYLRDLRKTVVWRKRFMWAAGELALTFAVAAAVGNIWLLAPFVLCGIATIYLYGLAKGGVLLQRALVLASEMLATDFANWGSAFPSQRHEAQMWLSSFGQTTRILETYPSLDRTDVVDAFRPRREAARLHTAL